jgi:hypothetical protein
MTTEDTNAFPKEFESNLEDDLKIRERDQSKWLLLRTRKSDSNSHQGELDPEETSTSTDTQTNDDNDYTDNTSLSDILQKH